jgi:glycosyltransferase involved in cell wall biosynthesis
MLGVRSDVGDLLAAADVFVLASRWEGLPGAAIEALAMGTPIVATDIPATRDVVGHNGLLVGVGDHEDLARAILNVVTSRNDARKRADAGMEDFRRRFTAGAMLDGMAHLYASLARAER